MPELPAIVSSDHRIIIAVGKQVLVPVGFIERYAKNIGRIRIDEPAPSRIVVPAVEVIQPRFRVVDIAPIAEGVKCAESGGERPACAPRLSPRVIGVGHYLCACAVHQSGHIALRIPEVDGAAAAICGAALSGAIAGGSSGAVLGAIKGGISNGWRGALDGACSGFMSGTLIGGATGAASAGLNIATGATTVVGNAHGSALHKLATNMEAGKMAASGQYSQIGINKSLGKMGLKSGYLSVMENSMRIFRKSPCLKPPVHGYRSLNRHGISDIFRRIVFSK